MLNKILVAAALVGFAAGQAPVKSTIKSDSGNLIFSSPNDGSFIFKDATTFSIEAANGPYDLNERLAAIEAQAVENEKTRAEQQSKLAKDFADFKNKTEQETTKKLNELQSNFDEKSAAVDKQLANMKKACPLGSVVTQVGEDGTLQCTDYRAECPAGEAVVSVKEDGTSVCAKVQAPVQACPAGSSIQSVNADTGAVTCEVDGADREFSSFFTVWGRSSCTGEGELVYHGGMAAGVNYRYGGSATYMCVPGDQKYAIKGFTGANNEGVGINMVELRSKYDLTGGNNRWAYNNDLDYDDMACAVCKVKSPNTLVVPARTSSCPAGYRTEYVGWLASTAYNENKVQEWICLFNSPMGFVGQSTGRNNRGFLYLTELESNGLKIKGVASGYKHNTELGCTQCSSTSEVAVKTYIRWGSNVCPAKSRKLYDGFVTNGRDNEKGGGVSYNCLPVGPEYNGEEGRASSRSARMYKVDFQTATMPGGGSYRKMHSRDVSCALCEVEASAVLTIPGTQKCPSGYDLEFKGLLFASRYSAAHMTQHICVDDAPIMAAGGSAKFDNAGRLNPVELGSTPPTSKAKTHSEVGCAVCKSTPERHVTSYTTWGKQACPSGSKTVYSGWMANGKYTHRGGGFNYQCMSADSDIEAKQVNKANNNGNSAILYRVKYSKSTKSNAGEAWGKMLKKNGVDAACAVCEVEGTSTLMLPAKDACPTGYKKLYDGYIAGGHMNQPHDTEYICLEKDFEGLDTKLYSVKSNDGGRLFLGEVDTSWYGLKYKYNYGLQCVMCSRE